MSLKEVTYYTVVCDQCGKDGNAAKEYTAWADGESALLCADAWEDWLILPDSDRTRHYCPGCWTWDTDADERIPKAPTSRPIV